MFVLKQLLTPPRFKDEEKTHEAYLLLVILSIFATLPIPFAFYILIQKPEELGKTLTFIATSEIINFISYITLRRGYVRQASIFQIIAFWILLTAASITSSSIYGVAYTLGNALILTMAGILLGGWGAFAMTLLVIAEGGALVYAELHGWIPPDILDDVLSTWIVIIILVIIGASLQNLAFREMRAALKRAHSSEEQYRLISEVSSDYTFSAEVDSDGTMHLTWVAGAFETITGFTFEEYITSGGWIAHLHPDDVEKDVQDTAMIKTNKPVTSEIRTIKKNGDISWVRVYAHPIWDDKQNRLTGIVGAVQDITQQKITETMLAYERDLLQIFMDNIPDNIYFKDTESRFIRVNQAQARFLNIDNPQDAIGKTDFDFHIPELAENFRKIEKQIMETGEPLWNLVEFNSLKDEEPVWFSTTKVPAKNEFGEIVGIVGLSRNITKQKQFEETLAYERDLLQIFMDNIPDTLYFKDTESRFIRINKSQANLLRVNNPQDAIGKTDMDFFPPDLAQQFFEEEKQILASGKPVINRIEFNPTEDGKPRWLSSSKAPVRDSSGNLIGTIGVSRDITQQKTLETMLSYQRDILQIFMDNIPDQVYFKDTESRFVRVNQEQAHFLGLSNPQDAIGKTDLDFQPPELARFFLAEEKHIMETGEPVLNRVEFNPTRDGKPRWLSSSKVPAKNELGQIIGTIGISVNVTEQKLQEEKESQRREMLEKVIQLGKQVAEVSDLQTTLKRIWHAVHDDLGFDRLGIYLYDPELNSMNGTYGTNKQGEMVEEWNLHISINDETVEAASFIRVLRHASGLYTTQNYEVDHNVPKGNIMSGVKEYAAVAARAGEKPVAVIGVDNLLSQRSMSNEQLEALRLFAGYAGLAIENSRLNSTLQTELNERQILIDELEAKNAELERFTYTVSHDLKSPLVTITGFLGYLEKDALTGNKEKIEGSINRISRAAEKMQDLLNDLLKLSRIGRLMNPPEDVPFEEIVNEAVEHVQGHLDMHKVQLEIQKDLPIIRGDRARLVEVIQNLIDNAAKYSNPGIQPIIEIGAIQDQDKTVYFVRDNGIGIDPQFHERIFGLFNKLNPHSDGTGVGLSLIKRIIEVHNGQIWVESEAGKGATFYFTLPTA